MMKTIIREFRQKIKTHMCILNDETGTVTDLT